MRTDRLVTVTNLQTNDEIQFDGALPRSYMVAYAFAEERNELPRLFSLRKANENTVSEDAIRRAFPIEEGQVSIGCGNWATLKQSH